MYKKQALKPTTIKQNDSYIGESIEEKVKRILSNKENITDGAPLIYTERKDGVQPSYNIRTDRFEVAVEAMEGVSKMNLAKREERAKVIEMDNKPKDGEPDSIQGTTSNI